jgi:uncharacterized protein
MSHQPVFDGLELAASGAALRGTLAPGDFPRLSDKLASDAGAVDYAVQGLHDEKGRPCLRVTVRGVLQLRCQRCLEALELELDLDEILVLASSQAEFDAEPPDAHEPDRVLAGKEMPVRELIEDELILAVPYAPRHESCAAAIAAGGATSRPFAGLRGLVRGKH